MPRNEQKIRQIWYGGRKPTWFKIQLSKLFSQLVSFRLKLYSSGLLKTNRLKIPVFIVGNITAGGGGKTPMVIWLVNELKRMKYKPGVISRGYGGKRKVEPMFVTANANPQASGDEPLLIAKKTNVPVAVGKNRYKAAKMLHKDYHVNCLVSDDGMQHYALHRDMEIVMLDAQWQLGNEMMMPAGPLREPKQRLDTVDLILYKGYTDKGHHYTSNIGSIYKLNKPSVKKKVEDFRSQKLYAMAGIANPNSFFSMLSAHGLAVIKKYLPDHHEFTEVDFEYEHDYPILITEKDAVKCEHINKDNVWVVSLDIEMTATTKRHYRKLISKVLNNE